MVPAVPFLSSSLEQLSSHGKSKEVREEVILSEHGKQGYDLEVGDEGRSRAANVQSLRSRDQEIGQQTSSPGECRTIRINDRAEQSIMPSATSPESGEDGKSESLRLRNLGLASPSIADSSTTTALEATTLAPSPLDATVGNVVVVEAPLVLHNALGHIVTKHPRLMSSVSTVLITVGSIVLFPGVTACAAGTILAHPAVTIAGGVSVVVGKWLRAVVRSATADSEAQAESDVPADV